MCFLMYFDQVYSSDRPLTLAYLKGFSIIMCRAWSMTFDALTFDVVIVGGGQCGCVVASRLHQMKSQLSIALIESGPDDHENLMKAKGPFIS